MRAFSLRLLTVLGLSLSLLGCDTTKEDFKLESATDYVALAPGKYITYRLDSTVFTQQGRSVEVHYYQEKHVIDAEFMDNSGRKSYRVFRFLSDTAGQKPWTPAGTYVITPVAGSVEVVEDNMRVIKLISPVQEGTTWKGNRYLGLEPFKTKFSFVNDDFMPDWEFTYTGVNDVFTFNNQTLPNVVTVLQTDERYALDTVRVASNTANLPLNSGGVWLEGTANDTVRLNAPIPSIGHEQLTIYNRTTKPATLNGIVIPSMKGLYFEFSNGKWYYPNPLTWVSNPVNFPRSASLAYIFGTSTSPADTVKVNVSNIDTFQTKKITIYNRTVKPAVALFNSPAREKVISAGKGRSYELYQGTWRLYENQDVEFSDDPYITDLPFGTTSYSIEKYAKGTGLVYQELLLWEYQPNTGGTPYKVGFGVKRSMIDHN